MLMCSGLSVGCHRKSFLHLLYTCSQGLNPIAIVKDLRATEIGQPGTVLVDHGPHNHQLLVLYNGILLCYHSVFTSRTRLEQENPGEVYWQFKHRLDRWLQRNQRRDDPHYTDGPNLEIADVVKKKDWGVLDILHGLDVRK